MKRIAWLVLATIVSASTVTFAVDKRKAEYVGGTIAGLKEKAEGRLDTTDERYLMFNTEDAPTVRIPYRSIVELEYGQKAGRRVGVAILVSPLALFSKKRNHYLSISYKDEKGKEQAAIFELGKDIVRPALKVIETRSGKKIHYQDDEARKSGLGGN
ncbi:MAG TPA: hypothetical protein VM364_00885 [Vicinamibacterales bacterium]|nr:hypothetical protein [Vicinamibacterales bacterium]